MARCTIVQVIGLFATLKRMGHTNRLNSPSAKLDINISPGEKPPDPAPQEFAPNAAGAGASGVGGDRVEEEGRGVKREGLRGVGRKREWKGGEILDPPAQCLKQIDV